MLPLEGITVVSLEHAIAAPFATRQLADMGARVIKVERPGVGDFARSYDTRVNGMASHFVWTNRSKESLTLDVKHSDGADILQKLVTKADVVVQNLAPGAAARLGLGYEDLSKTNSGVIVCNISGYGRGGPDENRKAYDLLIQSESGFVTTTGTPNCPSKAGISIADIAAGMYAYTNILTALMQREKTRKGCEIDLSMLDAMTEWMSYPLYYAYEGAEPPARAGASHATIFPYGPFAVGDRRTVILGLQNEREWKAFCDVVLEAPGLATDSRFSSNSLRAENKIALTQIITSSFDDLTTEAVIERLDRASIANANMNDMSDVWHHVQFEARNRWREVQTPKGSIPALLPPGGIGSEPRMDAVPALGEHSADLLAELGYSGSEISRLQNERVI
ncbi:CaiB/BaiF CoA-transferase family protein [Phaeobacter sp. 11ANDIMAR09]|uniref:CaiB/BaiF CoA transferase family protein n=1 Tax=Phaeobacter sp. 11ANDIMAR09 TaxID=1225647 RepID=UPI0006C87B10|nr:CaiB/BaiF CoA-transferase family protein [Phaeobacter sp. 11ANDIMAR09]KPD11530.1 CoA-transferase [Phaeobacter sp. 11ANDIMAR09]